MDKGYFISFEGMDGSGKSTQINELKCYLEQKGFEVILTREPGGTDIGEQIRRIILDPDNSEMTHITEAMLYAASRAQHIEEVILPAVASGKIVICDRFVDSSVAYQGFGRGITECVNAINAYAVQDCMPDITFLLKVKPQIGSERIKHREKDRIELEASEFHQAVFDGYERLEAAFPERIVGIDAARSIGEIQQEIVMHVDRLTGQRK